MKPVEKLNIDEIIKILKEESPNCHKKICKVDNQVVAFLMDVPMGTIYEEYKTTKRFDFFKNVVLKSKLYDNIDNLIKLGKADIWALDFKEIKKVVLKSKNPYWCVEFLKAFLFSKINPTERRDYEDIILKGKVANSIAEYMINFPSEWLNVREALFKTRDRNEMTRVFQNMPCDMYYRCELGQKIIDTYFDNKAYSDKKSNSNTLYSNSDRYPSVPVIVISSVIGQMVNGINDNIVTKEDKEEISRKLNNYLTSKVKDYNLEDMMKNKNVKLM